MAEEGVLELLNKEDDRLKKEAEERKKKTSETQPRECGDKEDQTSTCKAQKGNTEDLEPPTILSAETTPADAEEEDPPLEQYAGHQEVSRVKGQKWCPPEGKIRCGGQCSGCQRKCEDQGIDDCHSCYQNKTKGGKNGCCNREECTNLHPAMLKGNKGKNVKKNNMLGDSLFEDLLQKSPRETSKVGTQLVTFQPGQVESLAKDLEVKGKAEKEDDAAAGEGKRRRPEGDTPPDLKRTSKMPTMRKDMGGSKIQLPGKVPSLTS